MTTTKDDMSDQPSEEDSSSWTTSDSSSDKALLSVSTSNTDATTHKSRFLVTLAPRLGAIVAVVLTVALACVNMKCPLGVSVSAWTENYKWMSSSSSSSSSSSTRSTVHRGLYHPKGDIRKYFLCTRIMSNSDRNYDNSLDVDEYRVFINALADETFGMNLGRDSTSTSASASSSSSTGSTGATTNTLPLQLQDIFTDYANRTEGKSSDIIDIYGSGSGEQSGISAEQQNLLEGLCNATNYALQSLFKDEAERLGVQEKSGEIHDEDATPAPTPVHRAPKKLYVNTSFTMTLPGNMTVEDLQHTLETGEDPGGLKQAFQTFADDVVHSLGGVDTNVHNETDVRGLRGLDEFWYYSGHSGHRRLDIGFDDSSAEIYNFILSPCPGQAPLEADEGTGAGILGKLKLPGVGSNEHATLAIPPERDEDSKDNDDNDDDEKEQEEEDQLEEKLIEEFELEEEEDELQRTEGSRSLQDLLDTSNMTEAEYVAATANMSRKELRCVTALGKFRVDVDEEEEVREGGLEQIYQRVEAATTKAIDDGILEQRLKETPQETIFHVEGRGVMTDAEFDPYLEIEDDGLRSIDIVLISFGSVLIFCLCCVLCFVELERKTRPRPGI